MPPVTVNGPASGSLAFTYAHGLGYAPGNVQVQMAGPGDIWVVFPYWDATNVYLEASDYNLTALLTITAPGLSDLPVVGGYCSITDVTNAFPSFQRNAPNSVQDSQITSWIQIHAIRIRSALMQRGTDPGSPSSSWPDGVLLPNGVAISNDQVTFVQGLNADGAIGELGRALEGNVSLQPGEFSLVSGRRKNYETMLKDVRDGRYDAFWGLQSRLWGSVGGAETDRSTPGERQENRAFGRNQEF